MCDAYLKYVKYGTSESSDLESQWYAINPKLLASGHVQARRAWLVIQHLVVVDLSCR